MNNCIAEYGRADGPRGEYKNWDIDLNGEITIQEVRIILILSVEVMVAFDVN